jgi:O-succinylbenzoic acid--CoA ligase
MKLIELFNTNILNEEVNSFLNEWYSDSSWISLMTSGSTGTPKKIEVKKSKMIISAKKTNIHFGISDNSDVLLCLSPQTIGGKMMIVRSIVGNFNLNIGQLNANPLQEIDQKIDFCAMVPMQLINSLNYNSEKLSKIGKIIIGGAPLPIEIENKISKININVFHTFGMTETLSHFAIRQIGVDGKNVYNAMDGIKFSLSENKLIVDYPEILDQPLVTNEIVNLINDEQFEWIGRSDFAINSGGIKIFPEVIESKINSIIQTPFFVTSKNDKYLGERLILVIENSELIQLKKIDFLNILNNYEIPKEVFALPEFVRTESGKINRLETINLISDVGIKIL